MIEHTLLEYNAALPVEEEEVVHPWDCKQVHDACSIADVALRNVVVLEDSVGRAGSAALEGSVALADIVVPVGNVRRNVALRSAVHIGLHSDPCLQHSRFHWHEPLMMVNSLSSDKRKLDEKNTNPQ